MQKDNLFRAMAPAGEVREKQDGKLVLSGHFARFNEWTEIDSVFEGHFLERVAPGAFARTIASGKPKVLLNHGNDTLGKTPIGKVAELREDDEGAYYEVELFRGLPEHVVDGLKEGEYGASFRFSALVDERDERPARSDHNPEALPERTLTEVRLHEFGPVTFPAYEGATAQAAMRSITDEMREQELATLVRRLAEKPEMLRELISRLDEAEEPVEEPAEERQDEEPAEPVEAEAEREQDEPTPSDDTPGDTPTVPEKPVAAQPIYGTQTRQDAVPLYGSQIKETPSWLISSR
jgi:HK97 family phage prohead protease